MEPSGVEGSGSGSNARGKVEVVRESSRGLHPSEHKEAGEEYSFPNLRRQRGGRAVRLTVRTGGDHDEDDTSHMTSRLESYDFWWAYTSRKYPSSTVTPA